MTEKARVIASLTWRFVALICEGVYSCPTECVMEFASCIDLTWIREFANIYTHTTSFHLKTLLLKCKDSDPRS